MTYCFLSHSWRPALAVLLLGATLRPAAAQAPQLRRALVQPAPHSALLPGQLLTLPYTQGLNASTVGGVQLQSSHAGPGIALAAGSTDSVLTVLPTQPFRAGETITLTVPGTVQGSAGAAALPYCLQYTAATLGGNASFTRQLLRVSVWNTIGVLRAEPCDLNNDQLQDLVVSTDDSVNTWLAQAGGGYRHFTGLLTSSWRATAVRATDLNHDGNADVVFRRGADGLYALLGSGTGGFTAQSTLMYYAAGGPSDYVLEVADLNFDGRPDLLTGNSMTHQLAVYHGAASGLYPVGAVLTVGWGGHARLTQGTLGDFNEDGLLDVVTTDVAQAPGYAVATVSLRTPAGGFTPVFGNLYPAGFSVGPWYPRELQTADVNHDGHLDLLTTTFSGTLAVLLGDGTGQLAHAPGSPFTFGSGEGTAIAVGDLNADNHPDAVVGTADPRGTYQLQVLLGEGNGQFTPGAPLPLPGRPEHISLSDLDNDGDLDIVAPLMQTQYVALLLNQASLPPRLLSAMPGSAAPGSLVEVSGTNLSGTTAVAFNGVPAQQFSTNALGTALRVTVPAGATSGLISVATRVGRDTLRTAFTVLATPAATAGARAPALFTLAPNPAHHLVRLHLAARAAALPPAQLLDATGRLVRTLPLAPGQPTADLELAGLPAGLYLVRVGSQARRLLVE
ncbi:FG-GAP-like repeat-containing protein [Hymenobacter sp. ASUV-10]|uniref:FG-GAP-like repeat-containing protein n=1 Tax=Hymenobacter aranciens TaxID=3063996 RepID=A0ABT9BHH8_9BACT|nr:FG-GAP-like repeat-containing protein [Hymenobacter sp. ASUV-10]MDO7877714.1 FG-GAP-like repeat-containing protein [Hymenobacter sp. ASUV-10]